MTYLKLTILLFLLISGSVNSQIILKSGELYLEVASDISSMPGNTGDNFQDPTPSELTTWENVLDNLFADNYQLASDSANTIGYELINFTDTLAQPNQTYYILETADSNYWGTYVYFPNYCRPVIVQSPHSKKDANTGNQGIHVFRETKSLFYMVNGTHRCNSSSFTSCSGTTTGCSGTSEPYRISDLAHSTLSVFQKTTEIVLQKFNNSHFIQLHGFTKLSTDPYVILSNGTQVTPSPDYLSTFRDKLFEADASLTFKVAHLDLTWTRLRGFWNAQGRLINNSPNPCNTSATTSEGRFFHIEQEKTKLRDDSTGWNKIAYAVNNTFSCNTVSLSENDGLQELLVYPNPASNAITLELKGVSLAIDRIKIFNQYGVQVNDQLSMIAIDSEHIQVNLEKLPRGFYIVQIDEINRRILKM